MDLEGVALELGENLGARSLIPNFFLKTFPLSPQILYANKTLVLQ